MLILFYIRMRNLGPLYLSNNNMLSVFPDCNNLKNTECIETLQIGFA